MTLDSLIGSCLRNKLCVIVICRDDRLQWTRDLHPNTIHTCYTAQGKKAVSRDMDLYENTRKPFYNKFMYNYKFLLDNPSYSVTYVIMYKHSADYTPLFYMYHGFTISLSKE